MRTNPFARTLALTLLALLSAPAFAGWEEGVAAYKAGDFAKAAREFQAVVQERPDWSGGYLMLGATFLKLDRAQEAAVQLRKAYDLNPSDNGIKLNLAQAYVAAKRYREAAQLLQSMDANALPKDQQANFYQLRAAALDRSGQDDQALKDLRAAAQASPQNADAQYRYAQSAFASGELEAALRAYEASVRLDGKDPEKKQGLVKLLIRRAREGTSKEQSYRRAVEVARQLVAQKASYDYLLLLGEAQLGAKDYRDADATFQRAQQMNANDWLPLYYSGQAQTSSEQYREAERTLKLALNKVNSSKEQNLIWRQLAFVYEKQKNYAEAKSAYQRVGDQAGLARVAENERIAQENAEIEEHNKEIERLEQEAAELEKAMKKLPPN